MNEHALSGGDQPYASSDLLMADELVRLHQDTLIEMARSRRRRAGATDTLMTMDLWHEAYLKLQASEGFRSIPHFLAVASIAMRQVIVDNARRKLADKRRVPGESVLPEFSESPEQVVAIAQLLERMGALRPRWLRIVDARYFGGLTEEETAALLGLSERTVRRDWVEVRAWLAKEMGLARQTGKAG